MRGKSYFKNVLSEAEDMYSNASGRRSAFRGQAGNQQGGCGNTMAMNYDPSATCNDGSCVFREGCTLIGNMYFNPDAVIDDGSCSGYIPDLCDAWECPVFNVPAQFDSYADYVAYSQQAVHQWQSLPSCATGAGFLTGTKDPKGKGKRKRRGMRSASGRRSAFRGQTGASGLQEPKAPRTYQCSTLATFFGGGDSIQNGVGPWNLRQKWRDCGCRQGAADVGTYTAPSSVPSNYENWVGLDADFNYLALEQCCENTCVHGHTSALRNASRTKDPKKGMRSATGGGKRSVSTAVNWLSPLI